MPRAQRKLFVGEVALERHTVDDRAAESERTSGDAVRAVGADHCADLYLLPVHLQLGLGVDADAHPAAKLGPGGDCLLDEERIEPPALRHQTDDAARLPFDLGSVPQPEAGARDPVFHDGLDGGQLPDRPHRQPTAARLVPWEPRLVD